MVSTLQAGKITALAVNPKNASVLYATVWEGGGVHKSTDGGVTWLPSSNGFLSLNRSNESTEQPFPML